MTNEPSSRSNSQLQIAALEHGSVWLGQHGYQHLVGERRIHRVPVDVEEVRVDRGLSVLEYIHPPRVVGSHDADVIRHDVEDVAHAMRAQLRHEPIEILTTADLRIEGVVIDDVIAVCTACARAEIGRAVDVTDTQGGEVGDDRRQVVEGEAGIELHAVGGARNPPSYYRSRSHVTLHGASSLRARAARIPGWVAKIMRPPGRPMTGAGVSSSWRGGAARRRPAASSRPRKRRPDRRRRRRRREFAA